MEEIGRDLSMLGGVVSDTLGSERKGRAVDFFCERVVERERECVGVVVVSRGRPPSRSPRTLSLGRQGRA